MQSQLLKAVTAPANGYMRLFEARTISLLKMSSFRGNMGMPFRASAVKSRAEYKGPFHLGSRAGQHEQHEQWG